MNVFTRTVQLLRSKLVIHVYGKLIALIVIKFSSKVLNLDVGLKSRSKIFWPRFFPRFRLFKSYFYKDLLNHCINCQTFVLNIIVHSLKV